LLDQSQLTDALHAKRLSRQDALLVCLAADVDSAKSVKQIKELARNAGYTEVQKWNVSAALKRTKGLSVRLKDGWSLSSRGREHVRDLGIIPTGKSLKVVNHAAQLRSAASKISDPDTRAFVEEAIVAYEGGLHRSCVVLSWSGAVSLLYDQVVTKCLGTFNTEASRRDANWRKAKNKDDLTRMKESDFLDIIGSPPVSVIGKNVKEELKNNCLRLRNSCGHPNSLKIGENKTSAHLEVLILNIFAKFS